MDPVSTPIISSQSIVEKRKIRPFHLLSLISILIFVLSNIAAIKVSKIGEISIISSAFFYPIIYIINNILTEVYGFRVARRVTWVTAGMNIICSLLLYLAVLMPDAPDIETNLFFNEIFGISLKILIASSCSFVLGQYISSMLLAKTKLKFNGRFFAGRAIFSVALASLIDTFVFVAIVFCDIPINESLIKLSSVLIGMKIVYQLICIPITVNIIEYLQNREQLDFYDYKTKFTLFSF